MLSAPTRNCPALVLNADFRPLSYFPLSLWPWQEAIKAVFLDRVNIIADYDRVVRSPTFEMRLPSVISLKEYIPSARRPAFTRFNVFLRDRFTCQYCGERLPTQELTFDHVVPRSRGGRTTWTNVVTACSVCNLRKGHQLPQPLRHAPSDARRNSRRPISCRRTGGRSRPISCTRAGATFCTGTPSWSTEPGRQCYWRGRLTAVSPLPVLSTEVQLRPVPKPPPVDSAIASRQSRSGSVRPRHHRHGRDAVHRRAVDQLGRVGQVDQRVARPVVHPHHLRLLEQDRGRAVEHLLLPVDAVRQGDRADLAAGQGEARRVLGQAEPAGDAAGAGLAEIAGDARDVGVGEGLDADLVVRADQLEGGVDAADILGPGAGSGQQRRRGDEKSRKPHRQTRSDSQIAVRVAAFTAPESRR